MANNQRPIDQFSNRDILTSLYMSQGLLLLASLVIYGVFIRDFKVIEQVWMVTDPYYFIYALIVALAIVGIELVLEFKLPGDWFQDNGTNERLMQALSIPHLFVAMAVVAIVEELLFRGMLQTEFGLVISSILFAVIHLNYIKKPILLGFVILLSFILGGLFALTHSLIITILTHYLIDVLLGLYMKWTQGRLMGES
ncbi:CPBP family intramembrane metalloprotease [Pullulanibacillus sp. KACC 23026]|uniref:CPBP family intramembrane glutamic endopeptidase n=1 Tax=Pullulanibacillus sp. KACC 23026 TaxID=3028315 RepID=UPI0023B145E2|nr:CPBP family intramembrane glutamic endopeptidase [Pullulanibacillus sp. KACC 23026]WEG14927.1 CPBP family intramembrane metalloprotease [Pullulanibacillus sp. KACC 23026]